MLRDVKFGLKLLWKQKAFSFAALLTSSAIHPEQLGATRATQRYAVSRSRQWILGAHADLVARDRMQIPPQAELPIASGKGTSADGTNAPALAGDLRQHYNGRIEAAVASVKLPTLDSATA